MFVARADAMAYAYYGASMECPLQPHWIACVFPVFVSHCFNELCPEREPDAFQGRSCALCSFFFSSFWLENFAAAILDFVPFWESSPLHSCFYCAGGRLLGILVQHI